MTTGRGSSLRHSSRWRPNARSGPICRYTFDNKECRKRGAHYCEPRADRVVRFFAELLVHTKGAYARRSFELRPWQEHDIVRPIFGEVVWSAEWRRYVRRFQVAYIVVARKSGKSSLVSGIMLYLLVGDDEEGAEVYGAAKTTKQAGKVFEPAWRMVQLSPTLAERLRLNKHARRIIDERMNSYFEVIASDDKAELGHNPHGFYLDEVLSQPDDSLWNAMRTGAGARTQPLMLCITTETNDPVSFGATMIDEAERIQEDPKRAPHVFSYVRKMPRSLDELERLRRLFPGHVDVPVSLDVFDETNWKWPNPGLDDFLSREALRQEATEARNDATKENPYRQYRMNQRVQQVTRYIPLDLWDANVGEVAANRDWLAPQLAGRRCWAGLDLSARLDLTSWCLLFDDGSVLWRFWAPESVVPYLDEHTGGQFSVWCRRGWVTLTDGDTIDYDRIYRDIDVDHQRFSIAEVTYDKWSGEPVAQEVTKRTGLLMVESATSYERMTPAIKEFMRRLKDHGLRHGGHPVARWMADCLEVKSPADDPERVRPVKPTRETSGKRIDGMVSLFLAVSGQTRQPQELPAAEVF